MDITFSFVTLFCFFFKQKTAYEMRISDWSSYVCSSYQFYPRADRLERSKQGHLFGFHAQRHDANGWMMRIIRGSITILKSEQCHSPALCSEMIAQKADNKLRQIGREHV